MQIFKPDSCYSIAAIYLDDKRLNKQILEIVEAIQILKGDKTKMHSKHPIILEYAKYGNEAIYDLQYYLFYLLKEYECRFDKEHSYTKYLDMDDVTLFKYENQIIIYQYHSNLLKIDYNTTESMIITAYQKLLRDKWDEAFLSGNRRRIPKWTKRKVPYWYEIPEV